MSPAPDLPRRRFFATTVDGWELELWRHRAAETAARRRPTPVLIVPGYAQTPYLFGVHPRGPSLIEVLTQDGFETWTMHLRGTGQSRARAEHAGPISLASYADEDLPAALEAVLERSTTGADRAFAIGSSLGGSVVYGYLARTGEDRVAGVVTLGAPLRWVMPNPVVRALFASRGLAGRIPMAGVAELAMRVLPTVARAGWLGTYVNGRHVNVDDARTLVGAITDPSPAVNAEIATWLAEQDLVLAGTDVAEALRRVTIPLLVVAANRDGLVPLAAARSVIDVWGGADTEVLEVGTRDDWFSHADLFVAPTAPERVFAPVARWLEARDGATNDGLSAAARARGDGARGDGA